MFINKMKEQLAPDKSSSFPHGSSGHYPAAVLTVPGPAVTMETASGGSAGRGTKQEGGSGPSLGGAHLHPPHTSQNITVVPVPSTGIMTAAGLVITTPPGALVSSPPSSSQSFITGHPTTTMIVSALHPQTPSDKPKTEEVAQSGSAQVAMQTPSKRGRKKKSVLPRATGAVGVGGHSLAAGSDALILAHLAAGGQHHTADPYDLSNDEDEHGTKDGNKSYRCRMCAVTFFSKSDMQIHAKSHTEAKPHKCPHCSKSFANSSYLAQHIRIHSGAKPYTCSYCQKTFRQLSHLQQHTRYFVLLSDACLAVPVFSLSLVFGMSAGLLITPGAGTLGCSVASVCGAVSERARAHGRIHTGDRPYKCAHPGCEKAFTQLSNLQSHRRQHNKDKPYKCHNCHRAYTDSASLEVHLSTHTVKHAKGCSSAPELAVVLSRPRRAMDRDRASPELPALTPDEYETVSSTQQEGETMGEQDCVAGLSLSSRLCSPSLWPQTPPCASTPGCTVGQRADPPGNDYFLLRGSDLQTHRLSLQHDSREGHLWDKPDSDEHDSRLSDLQPCYHCIEPDSRGSDLQTHRLSLQHDSREGHLWDKPDSDEHDSRCRHWEMQNSGTGAMKPKGQMGNQINVNSPPSADGTVSLAPSGHLPCATVPESLLSHHSTGLWVWLGVGLGASLLLPALAVFLLRCHKTQAYHVERSGLWFFPGLCGRSPSLSSLFLPESSWAQTAPALEMEGTYSGVEKRPPVTPGHLQPGGGSS
ncbi:ZN384 protein, partial [Atractosteus spatula]|nr:ZN384 protein [Atractosteus spatula]